MNFGYSLNSSRTIDLDKLDKKAQQSFTDVIPTFKRCFACGGCSATCSAQQHTDFNVLKCNLLFRRGEMDTLAKELEKCMLCGKCTLVCPRNVNTRAMIIKMRKVLNSKPNL